jgi:uncharacterized membrane protein YheB (UPF0754 family)
MTSSERIEELQMLTMTSSKRTQDILLTMAGKLLHASIMLQQKDTLLTMASKLLHASMRLQQGMLTMTSRVRTKRLHTNMLLQKHTLTRTRSFGAGLRRQWGQSLTAVAWSLRHNSAAARAT